ncbi:D-3-phosphoglycerate dehydrogenase 3, chloroplastic-like [Quercus suber]|uniref:D-3-phosphoglycerate dehydrogenase 3 n=1 Tax=Quercus suber TaxID=58331 RepID=A0AAW0LNU8_QUESU
MAVTTSFHLNFTKPQNNITTTATPLSSSFLSWKISLPSSFTFSSSPRKPKSFITVSLMNSKPTILVAEKLGEAGIDLLKSFANVDCSYNLSPEELCTKISLCDALIVRSGTKVTREVFEFSGGRLLPESPNPS